MASNKLCKDNLICCDDDCCKCANRVYQSYLNLKENTVEVIHAYWRDCFKDDYCCTNCKHTVPKRVTNYKYHYCPYCGAKMDKEIDHETY